MKPRIKKRSYSLAILWKTYTQQRNLNIFRKNVVQNEEGCKLFFSTLSDFERELLHASLINLFDRKNKLHINNFAYAIRELITNYLNRKAPVRSVELSPWFHEERVSRKHQVKYLIQKNINDNYFSCYNSKILDEIRECGASFSKIFNKLNKLTHINKKTFNYNSHDGYEYIRDLFDSVLFFFTMSENLEIELQKSLADYIEGHLYDEITNETIDAIDECSTHHMIEDTYIHDIIVTNFNEEYIYFNGEGEISVEQQYGSNSDLRRGDGMTVSTSFPVSFSGKVETSDFSLVEIDSSYEVNNDEHYGIALDKKHMRRTYLNRLYWCPYRFIKNIFYKTRTLSRKNETNFDDIDF